MPWNCSQSVGATSLSRSHILGSLLLLLLSMPTHTNTRKKKKKRPVRLVLIEWHLNWLVGRIRRASDASAFLRRMLSRVESFSFFPFFECLCVCVYILYCIPSLLKQHHCAESSRFRLVVRCFSISRLAGRANILTARLEFIYETV